MVIVARDEGALLNAFAKAGWTRADPLRITSVMKWIGVLASDTAYPAAPVSPSFWNGCVNDLSFEKPTPARNGTDCSAI
jgi:undecaprenyl-diphosphatase